MGNYLRQTLTSVFPSSEKDFFLKVVPANVTFNKNGDSKVLEMELHQSWAIMKLKKIK